MKKNIFSVIITVLTVVNVVLTAIMFFIMVPTFNKTNNLITQVASVLNLELDGDSDAKGDADYKISDLEDTTVSFDSQQTINLKTGSDNSQHYAMLSGYTISVNKKADDYKDFAFVDSFEWTLLSLSSHIFVRDIFVLYAVSFPIF